MRKITIYLSVLTLFVASCSKSLDEANINNNNPEDVKISELLPSAEAAIAYTIGNQFQIYGGVWAQYWTQGSTASQYLKNEQMTLANTDQNRPWSQMYSGALKDLQIIKTKALSTSATDSQMYAMALVLEAYTFQVLSDAYEKVPMTDALVDGNLAPAYDEPTAIYDAIETKLVTAKGIFSRTTSPQTYSFDLLFGGTMTNWVKFANTLLLRVYMRQSYARPAVASAGIAKNLTGASFMTASTDNVMTRYIDAQNQRNPLHAAQLTLANFENLKASNTSLNILNTDADKRIASLYNKNASGAYNGFNQGAGKLVTASTANTNFSNIGDKVGGIKGAAAPVIWMSNWESYFLQAEAIARGWLGGTATTMYSNGIRESHLYHGFTAADATAVAGLHPLSGSADAQAGLIMSQKWMAMNGTQCFEAYTELRRFAYALPYPTFPASAVSVYGAGFMPYRFPLPESEVSTNPNTPTTKVVHTKMWFSK